MENIRKSNKGQRGPDSTEENGNGDQSFVQKLSKEDIRSSEEERDVNEKPDEEFDDVQDGDEQRNNFREDPSSNDDDDDDKGNVPDNNIAAETGSASAVSEEERRWRNRRHFTNLDFIKQLEIEEMEDEEEDDFERLIMRVENREELWRHFCMGLRSLRIQHNYRFRYDENSLRNFRERFFSISPRTSCAETTGSDPGLQDSNRAVELYERDEIRIPRESQPKETKRRGGLNSTGGGIISKANFGRGEQTGERRRWSQTFCDVTINTTHGGVSGVYHIPSPAHFNGNSLSSEANSDWPFRSQREEMEEFFRNNDMNFTPELRGLRNEVSRDLLSDLLSHVIIILYLITKLQRNVNLS